MGNMGVGLLFIDEAFKAEIIWAKNQEAYSLCYFCENDKQALLRHLQGSNCSI